MPSYDDVMRGAKVPVRRIGDMSRSERAEWRRRYGALADLPSFDFSSGRGHPGRGVVSGVDSLAKVVEVADKALGRDHRSKRLMDKFATRATPPTHRDPHAYWERFDATARAARPLPVIRPALRPTAPTRRMAGRAARACGRAVMGLARALSFDGVTDVMSRLLDRLEAMAPGDGTRGG